MAATRPERLCAVALERTAAGGVGAVIVVADDPRAADALLALIRRDSPGWHAWSCVPSDLSNVADAASPSRPETVVLSCRSIATAHKRLADLHDVPSLRLVVIAADASPVQVRELFDAGVDGLVLERDLDTVFVPTLAAVSAGQLVLPRSRRSHLARPALSTREKQVLALVVLGFSNHDVAAKLHVAEATVKSHLTSSFRKLGVRSRSAAAMRILDPDEGLGVGILGLSGAESDLDVFTEA